MPKLTATDMSENVNAAGRATRYLQTIARACPGCPKRETKFCYSECGVRTAQDILHDLEHGNFSLGLIDNLTGKLECRNNDACYREAARKAKDKRKNHHASKPTKRKETWHKKLIEKRNEGRADDHARLTNETTNGGLNDYRVGKNV